MNRIDWLRMIQDSGATATQQMCAEVLLTAWQIVKDAEKSGITGREAIERTIIDMLKPPE